MRRGRLVPSVMLLGALLGVCVAAVAQPGRLSTGCGCGVEALLGAGSSTQGYLGVDIRDVSDDQVAPLKLKEARGAEIIHVDHDGPAGTAGLQERDVILQMNGQPVEGEDQLRRMLRETPAGRSVTLVISRDGQQQSVTARLANRAEVERKAWEDHWRVPEPPQPQGEAPASNSFLGASSLKAHNLIGALTSSSPYTGATVMPLSTQLSEFFGAQGGGVLVQTVDQNSPAEQAGLRAGDVVVRVGSAHLANSNDWLKALRENKGKPIAVVVLRDKHEQSLTMTPDPRHHASASSPGSSHLGEALR
ncbi:MAG: PDZ domain-containing protein [Acidobacteriota bacterium]|nr:PDZ domain-containing protein [Acidobacteriota bacterium]